MGFDDHGYTLIAAYGRHIGSLPHYIQSQCDQALADGAPFDAIHQKDGKWVTADKITHRQLRIALGLLPVLGPSADVTALCYRPRDERADVFVVWLDTPGAPEIGTATRIPGLTERWSIHPRGEHTFPRERYASLEMAAHALAAWVPADAVYFRRWWVVAGQITSPTTRRRYGLPILPAALSRRVETLPVADVADMVLPTGELPEDVASLAPRAGQKAGVDHGRLYWMTRADTDVDPLSVLCDNCDAAPGAACEPWCLGRKFATLVAAPIGPDSYVRWDAATVVQLDTVEEEHAGCAQMARNVLLFNAGRTTQEQSSIANEVQVQEAEVRVWDPEDTGRPAKLYILEVCDAHISVTREDGRTLIQIDGVGDDTRLSVWIDGEHTL
jgi:hypothetical protein